MLATICAFWNLAPVGAFQFRWTPNLLRQKADEHGGLDYLQVFESKGQTDDFWFIEDGPGGDITALLPSDY